MSPAGCRPTAPRQARRVALAGLAPPRGTRTEPGLAGRESAARRSRRGRSRPRRDPPGRSSAATSYGVLPTSCLDLEALFYGRGEESWKGYFDVIADSRLGGST